MPETLFNAYLPLVLWTCLGILLYQFLPNTFPKLLGRSLYWLGVPLQILALGRRTDFTEHPFFTPAITVVILFAELLLTWLLLLIVRFFYPDKLSLRKGQGSFMLSCLLGNTGFVGLAVAPYLVPPSAISLVIFYSVANNILGSYGLGVFLASYFGRARVPNNNFWLQLRDVVTVPSLWAFIFGYFTHNLNYPIFLESSLQLSLSVVIPAALLLMGMRLSQINSIKSFGFAFIPAVIKVVVFPALVGIAVTLLGLRTDWRLALVLMSGMPVAFAASILAEEYDLDREIIVASILLSTIILLLIIPLWLVVFA